MKWIPIFQSMRTMSLNQTWVPFINYESIFFVKTKEFLFQHYILTKFSFCLLFDIWRRRRKMLKKFVKMLRLILKHFFRQNKIISISTLHFDEIFILYFDIWQKKKKIAQKIRENVEVDIKALFSLKRKNFYFNITFWQNFHSVVWHLTKKKKNAQKIRENVEVDIKALFLSKHKNFYFNITLWRNFYSVVWHLTKKKKIAQKICENVGGVDMKSAYVIYEWPFRGRQWFE